MIIGIRSYFFEVKKMQMVFQADSYCSSINFKKEFLNGIASSFGAHFDTHEYLLCYKRIIIKKT